MNGANNSNEWKPLTRIEKRDRAEIVATKIKCSEGLRALHLTCAKRQVLGKGLLICEAH